MIGRVVSDAAAGADHVILRVFLAEVVFDEKVLGVIREAFVNPHVGSVFHRDVVAEPLVRRFVNDDEVELEADAAKLHDRVRGSHFETNCRK